MSGAGSSADPVGSVTEEAMRLVASMTAWAQEQGGDGDADPQAGSASESSGGETASTAGTDSAHHGDEPDQSGRFRHQGHLEGAVCGVCPICRGASFLDHLPSETIARAADLLGFFATAMSDLAAARGESQADAPHNPRHGGPTDSDAPTDSEN